jgi:hypothetical protein
MPERLGISGIFRKQLYHLVDAGFDRHCGIIGRRRR